ncbi:PREDICTED: uncharacterized protein LOC107191464 [Dufourea novaeangliae]|uniref:uncharacterized protein LOC107191464 n=1 Tax=Dufourea novaeangliae TaxID=178035 RepID=UPI0007673271|nr:PREDICTED: uncharacterized protein LOC107191464 [Dufourea novaeangliae]
MVKLRAIVTLTLFVILSINLVEPLMHKSLSKFLGSLASVKHVRIPEVLNQLCNESQGSDTIRQDACYGCFYKATNQPLGYPLLVAMSSCADLYLNNTDYDHCQRYLNNATSTPNTRINPTTIYCTFLECIRQVNKDNLEARVHQRTAPSPRKGSRKTSFIYLKLYKQIARNICIIRERDIESNTVRPGAEPIDPRRQSIQPKTT